MPFANFFDDDNRQLAGGTAITPAAYSTDVDLIQPVSITWSPSNGAALDPSGFTLRHGATALSVVVTDNGDGSYTLDADAGLWPSETALITATALLTDGRSLTAWFSFSTRDGMGGDLEGAKSRIETQSPMTGSVTMHFESPTQMSGRAPLHIEASSPLAGTAGVTIHMAYAEGTAGSLTLSMAIADGQSIKLALTPRPAPGGDSAGLHLFVSMPMGGDGCTASVVPAALFGASETLHLMAMTLGDGAADSGLLRLSHAEDFMEVGGLTILEVGPRQIEPNLIALEINGELAALPGLSELHIKGESVTASVALAVDILSYVIAQAIAALAPGEVLRAESRSTIESEGGDGITAEVDAISSLLDDIR
jgi:hypothetical protein